LVQRSANGLLGIINDILDFSKIEADRLELDPVPFRLRDAFRDLVKLFDPQARQKGLRLAAEIDPDVPDALVGDLSRLRQVLLTLVGNAIKFTERGDVTLSVSLNPHPLPVPVPGDQSRERVGDGDRESCPLCFSVRDTGIGIPADKLAAIFA